MNRDVFVRGSDLVRRGVPSWQRSLTTQHLQPWKPRLVLVLSTSIAIPAIWIFLPLSPVGSRLFTSRVHSVGLRHSHPSHRDVLWNRDVIFVFFYMNDLHGDMSFTRTICWIPTFFPQEYRNDVAKKKGSSKKKHSQKEDPS